MPRHRAEACEINPVFKASVASTRGVEVEGNCCCAKPIREWRDGRVKNATCL